MAINPFYVKQYNPGDRPTMKQSADVYSRCVGYMQPVGQWNDGKRAEFARRKTFDNSLRP